MTQDATIKAESLHLTFETNDGPVHALKDVNLEIEKGDFVIHLASMPIADAGMTNMVKLGQA